MNRFKRLKVIALSSIIVLAGVVAVSVGYAGYRKSGKWFNFSIAPPTDEVTSYDIVIHDALDSTNDEDFEDAVTLAWYGVDTEDMETEEIEDLIFSDFTLEDADDESFTPDDFYIYIMKASGTDIVTRYFTTDDVIFDGYLDELVLGINDVYLYNESEDVSMTATDELGGTIVLNTVYDDWIVTMHSLDASEGVDAKISFKEGYGYFYDPENSVWMSPMIRVTYNVTATIAFANIDDLIESDEVCSTTYTFFEIHENLGDTNTYHISFGSGMGTVFEVSAIGVGWGYSSSYTEKDTQD